MPDFKINQFFPAGERRLGLEVPNRQRLFLIPMNWYPFCLGSTSDSKSLA